LTAKWGKTLIPPLLLRKLQIHNVILIKPWNEAKNIAFPIRHAVFVIEQGVPKEIEIDEHDPHASHALACFNTEYVGTARLIKLSRSCGQIGRMAVLAHSRNRGVGGRLLVALIEYGKTEGMVEYLLHAQLGAIPFYEKLGFIPYGKIYDEAGISHRNMILLI